MKKLRYLLMILVLASACTPEAYPIEYGTDKCDFCRMTIVDKQHAAQLVTSKGKVHKFDAIECQVQYLQEQSSSDFALILVTDYYTNTGDLVNAKECSYLISPNISSPMGAFLSAFSDPEIAQQIQEEKGGDIYDWPSLNHHLSQ